VQGKKMWLHSSYPSTDGYGIQQFDIPPYTWFVRLVKTDKPATQTAVDQTSIGTQSAPAKNKHSKRKKKSCCK